MKYSMLATLLLRGFVAVVLFDTGLAQAQSGLPPASSPSAVPTTPAADAIVAPVRRVAPPKPKAVVGVPVRGAKPVVAKSGAVMTTRKTLRTVKRAKARASKGVAASQRAAVRPAKPAVSKIAKKPAKA